ncbi:spermidine synthase [Luteolibacter algae]|uniref:Spermidine synthase n=1 Tax=Luteolibacter algae TaxID=454151 RepID=A0ABW5D4M3_9BACT
MKNSGDFQTRYQKVTLWKSDLATEFRVAGAIHASFHRKRFLTGLAWDLLAAGAMLRPGPPPESILMLGVAGGTALRTLRHLLPEVALTGIDLDRELIALAKQEMELEKTGAKIIIADAYEWMKTNTRRFDIIIDDLYLAGEDDVIRAENCNTSWLSLLKKSLAPGGMLALNLVTGPGHRAKQIITRKNFCHHFPSVRVLHTEESMNEILIAGTATGTGRQLRQYVDCFSDWRDRMFWKRITVRKLRTPR